MVYFMLEGQMTILIFVSFFQRLMLSGKYYNKTIII